MQIFEVIPPSAMLTVACLFTVIWGAEFILSNSMKYDPVVKEAFPIIYPHEPKIERFGRIVEQIRMCGDEQDLKQAYVEIIIFQSCYKNSEAFQSELWDEYNVRQIELSSPKSFS